MLQIERVEIAKLTNDPDNVRLHGEESIDAIASSLRKWGQQKPIVVDGAGRVVSGNGTLQAARKLGWENIDVVRTRLEGHEAVAFAIADNRTAELSEWDWSALQEAIVDLKEREIDAGELGFDADAMRLVAKQLSSTIVPAMTDSEPVVPPAEPIAKLGDLWTLGQHRIFCGDSTKPEDVARLMDGEKAALLATDPPYLVDYRGGNHPQSGDNSPMTRDKRWDDYNDPADGYKDPATGLAFFQAFLEVALDHCREDVPVYQWYAYARQSLVEQAWVAAGLLVHQQIIWAKARPVLTRSHFMWQHEPCFYGWPKGNMPHKTCRPNPNSTTVWNVDQVGQQDGIHPTQKPLELFARPILRHTREGEIVLEPFSGSGTQIIAAEQLKRRCYAMEISPAYVDVAVQRWESLTGGTPECVPEGPGGIRAASFSPPPASAALPSPAPAAPPAPPPPTPALAPETPSV